MSEIKRPWRVLPSSADKGTPCVVSGKVYHISEKQASRGRNGETEYAGFVNHGHGDCLGLQSGVFFQYPVPEPVILSCSEESVVADRFFAAAQNDRAAREMTDGIISKGR